MLSTRSGRLSTWEHVRRYSQLIIFSSLTNYVYRGSRSSYSDFSPIEELATTAGDTVLVFLSANGVRYSEKVDDEWYSAHQIVTSKVVYHTSQTDSYFLSDEPASALGCNMLYQLCDPAKPPEQGCSALGGAYDTEFIDTPPQTQREKAQNWALDFVSVADVVEVLKFASLTSRFRVIDVQAGSLPVDQWQLEVEYWHNIAMSSFQTLPVISAAGPGDSGMFQYFWQRPSNDVEKYICKNQVCALSLF